MKKREELSLSVQNITKTYPGVVALNQVSIDFRKGEVHALMGENGAGKSTLMKVISGVTEPDSGVFLIGDREFNRITPGQSQACGIQIVHQELNLIPSLSVTENVFLGSFMRNGITVDSEKMRLKTKEYFQNLGIEGIDPDTLTENLTVAQMQLVEIVKAVSRSVEVLILDEPTSPLTTYETEILFRIIENLKKRRVTVIYISHRMGEIYRIADRVTILRDGQKIATRDILDVSRAELIKLMVGRELKETYPERKTVPGDVVLEVKGLCGNGMKGLNLFLRKGEILGLAGLVGAGRTEFVRLIYGADESEQGEIFVEGRKTRIRSPFHAAAHGIGLLPEDRKLQGVILELSVKENIILPSLREISKGPVIDSRREMETVKRQESSLRIKTPSLSQLVRNLSGGNQQKVVVSKWLASSAKILIFDEPTRGIDVGAKQEIYQLMNRLTEEGISIIMVSSEMEELIGMSDRIMVLREGRIAGELTLKEEFSQERIMELCSLK